MQTHKMLYNDVATYVNLTLKITFTFINETVKFIQRFDSVNTAVTL